jgi:hypothetical protein
MEDNNEMDFEEIECEVVAQYRVQLWDLVNMVNESFGSIKIREFFEQLSDCYLLKKDSVACNYLNVFSV